MSDCDNAELRDVLPDLIHGTLAPSVRARVEAHVGACAACRAELDLLRAAHVVLSRTPSLDVGRVVRALPPPPNVLGRPRAQGSQARGVAAAAWRRAAAIAAVVVTGAAVGIATRGPWPRLDRGTSTAAPQPAAPAAPGRTAPRPQPPAADAGDLMLAAGVQDLDDAQLDAILREIEALDPVPSAEPLPVLPAFAPEPGEGGV